ADPYCIIKCAGRKVTTPVQNDTLNPKFNAGGLFYVRNINGEVVIDVYDSNVFWDSFMGRAVIPIEVNNSTVQQSLKLKGKGRNSGEEISGTLTVKISCFAELKSV
ncbi:calpain-5-like, partial [Paramuricea clavata]